MFNIANILLVAAIDIAGMAVAFPVGIGLALVIGVITTYMAKPDGNPAMLFIGVACVAAAIVVDAWPIAGCRRPDRRRRSKASCCPSSAAS